MKDAILQLLNEGKTNAEIARELCIKPPTVTYWKKKLGFSLKKKTVDWEQVQQEYDSGKTLRELGVSLRSIQLAQRRGDFEARDIKSALDIARKKGRLERKHTTETKGKLRDHMLRRLADGTYPTLGRNFRGRKQSYPEQWWESVIQDRLADYEVEKEYRFGIYSLDFAWPQLKKCLEVDGGQHEEPNQKASDERKDEYIESMGWQVIRIPWKHTCKNKKDSIRMLVKFIEG